MPVECCFTGRFRREMCEALPGNWIIPELKTTLIALILSGGTNYHKTNCHVGYLKFRKNLDTGFFIKIR
jgi:hypothetical protein